MGKPWDVIFDHYYMFNIIESHSSYITVCSWFSTPSVVRNGWHSDHYIKNGDKSPLPKGEYYSKFDVNLGNEVVTCRRSFTIR